MTIAYIEGVVNNTNHLASVVDYGNVLDRTTTPAYVATGIQRLTLRERWKYVVGFATLEDTGANVVKVSATTDGSGAANVVDVQCFDNNLAAAAYTGSDKPLKVVLFLMK